jgi:hypothetical protein
MDMSECPVCDSKNIEIKEKLKEIFVPMAKPAMQRVLVCHCKDCGSDIRLSSDSQEDVEAKIREKANESMPLLIKKINEAGISDARLERALDLAAHTVNRWKQGTQISAAVLALARLIASQPKLVEFAEEGFADSDMTINVQRPLDFYRNVFRYDSSTPFCLKTEEDDFIENELKKIFSEESNSEYSSMGACTHEYCV